MPFKEIPHTADMCLHIWAVDLPTLFSESARGMYELSGLTLASVPVMERTFASTAPDPETLLVSFLSELIFTLEQEKIGFFKYMISIVGSRLDVKMKGSPVVSINKIIKAVTYHNLHIQQTGKGYETEIVFDI
jgi:protein archease